MCSKGKQQSPVNVDPDQLVYDEKLNKQQFRVDKQQISGSLHNTGQSLVFKIDADRAAKMPVNITGGPLSYRYIILLNMTKFTFKEKKHIPVDNFIARCIPFILAQNVLSPRSYFIPFFCSFVKVIVSFDRDKYLLLNAQYIL